MRRPRARSTSGPRTEHYVVSIMRFGAGRAVAAATSSSGTARRSRCSCEHRPRGSRGVWSSVLLVASRSAAADVRAPAATGTGLGRARRRHARRRDRDAHGARSRSRSTRARRRCRRSSTTVSTPLAGGRLGDLGEPLQRERAAGHRYRAAGVRLALRRRRLHERRSRGLRHARVRRVPRSERPVDAAAPAGAPGAADDRRRVARGRACRDRSSA